MSVEYWLKQAEENKEFLRRKPVKRNPFIIYTRRCSVCGELFKTHRNLRKGNKKCEDCKKIGRTN